jgi:dolichol-phosphate mannosyltransferase
MKISLVMPAYNEAEGIVSFLTELIEVFDDLDLRLVVIDDQSSDETALILKEFIKKNQVPLEVLVNVKNQGHGISTLRALAAGLASDPVAVIAIDGDGQFVGRDVRDAFNQFIESHADILEGVRQERGDFTYRRIVSWSTRALVFSKSRVWPRDANTPLRIYKPDVLRQVLDIVPAASLTPNLIISAIARASSLSIAEYPVLSIPRRGADITGTTWKNRWKNLPSKRFLVFVFTATRGWIQFSVRKTPKLKTT